MLDYPSSIMYPYLKQQVLDRNKQQTIIKTDTYSSAVMIQEVSINI